MYIHLFSSQLLQAQDTLTLMLSHLLQAAYCHKSPHLIYYPTLVPSLMCYFIRFLTHFLVGPPSLSRPPSLSHDHAALAVAPRLWLHKA